MALQVNIYDTEGKISGKVSLPKELFAAPISLSLMAQSVRVHLSNQRRAHARAKTRGQVTGSTRKLYRQKGTGRARHGDIKAPIFVGGGKAHGPTGEQNYTLALPKKIKKAALASALSAKFKQGKIVFLEGLEKLTGKTKAMTKILKNLPEPVRQNKKFLLVLPQREENIERSVRNLRGLSLVYRKNLSVYQVLNAGIILFTKEALKFPNEKRP